MFLVPASCQLLQLQTILTGLPWWLMVKNLPAVYKTWVQSLGWQATSPWGLKEVDTTEPLTL